MVSVCVRVFLLDHPFFARASERRRAQQKSSPSKALRSNFSRREPFLSFNTTAATTNTLHGASKREREREQKRNEAAFCSRGALIARCYSSLFLLSLLHIFPFESSSLLGEKAEDERLVLFYLVVVLVAEDGRKAEECEE